MDNSPEASRLVLLSQLPSIAAGTKVRFLGCVDSYDSGLAILKLRDRFPATSVADVNVNNLLDVLNVETTQVGAWVNIMGYLRHTTDIKPTSTLGVPIVDAILAWSAGPIKLSDYEDAVKALQNTAS